MSHRRIIVKRYTMILSVMSMISLQAMEDDDFEEQIPHQQPPAVAQSSATQESAKTTAAGNQPLVWQDQPGTEKTSGEGITTINEVRGNWFFKNQIGKDARKLNVEIHKKVAAIQPLQEKYLKDHEAVDAAFNAFNIEYGFHGGDIDARLDILIDQVTKLEETQSAHDVQETALLDELKKKKAEIEALKEDFDYLQKLDNALSQSLSIMSSQMTKVISYEDQASLHYDEIFEVLNDQTAEELFKKMKVLLDNITVIETYLTGEFSIYFKTTSQKIVEQIEVIKKHILDLKQQGIALGQKMRDLQAKEDEELRLKEQEHQEKQAQKKAQAERTWLSPLFDVISWTWKTVRDTVYWVFAKIGDMFAWLFSSKPEKVIAKKEVEQVPVPEVSEPEMYEPTLSDTQHQGSPATSEIAPQVGMQIPVVSGQQNVTSPVPAVPSIIEEPSVQQNIPSQGMPLVNVPTTQMPPALEQTQNTMQTAPASEVTPPAPVADQITVPQQNAPELVTL